MNEESQRKLTVGDGIRFGIGLSLVPLILALIAAALVLLTGGFAALFTALLGS